MVGNNRFKVGIYIRLSRDDLTKSLIVLLVKEVY